MAIQRKVQRFHEINRYFPLKRLAVVKMLLNVKKQLTGKIFKRLQCEEVKGPSAWSINEAESNRAGWDSSLRGLEASGVTAWLICAGVRSRVSVFPLTLAVITAFRALIKWAGWYRCRSALWHVSSRAFLYSRDALSDNRWTKRIWLDVYKLAELASRSRQREMCAA